MIEDYDAIVVGASFAGLAVARRLRGRVLLLDRHDVGAVQTSACGTPLWVPQALGVEASVLQVHTRVVVHAPTRTVVFDASDMPYCTFDYRRFCQGLLEQTGAEFLRTVVTGARDGVVVTEAGLKGPLVRFMRDLDLTPTRYHGTYFPAGLREPTVGRAFAVGDAAGHCLPLTAEGIRPALYFGDQCGQLVQAVVDGRLTLAAALGEYRRRVSRYRGIYRKLAWAQWAVLRAPRSWLGPMAALADRPVVRRRWWPRYAEFGALATTTADNDRGSAPEFGPRHSATHGENTERPEMTGHHQRPPGTQGEGREGKQRR